MESKGDELLTENISDLTNFLEDMQSNYGLYTKGKSEGEDGEVNRIMNKMSSVKKPWFNVFGKIKNLYN